ncbi:MAG: hypothetical protein QXI19_13880 [Candidatus Caldarchaeum sp.]
MAKGKYFRLPDQLEKEFSHVCKALGLSQNKALISLVEQFVQRYRGQLTITQFNVGQEPSVLPVDVLARLAEFDPAGTLTWLQDIVARQERGEQIKPRLLVSVAGVLRAASSLKTLSEGLGMAEAVETLKQIEELAVRFLERQLSQTMAGLKPSYT